MPMTPRQIPLDLPHRPSLSRDDLVVSPANSLAVGAVDSWPSWPHPVVVAVGPEGSGKTHLAQVFAAQAETAPATPEGVDAMLAAAPFAAVLDDVDGGAFSEAQLFAILNAARLGQGTVFATARQMPAAMPVRLPDLASRLRAATVVPIRAPDDELLVGVLAKLFADRQLLVEERILAFMAARMERSLAEAVQLVDTVDREALAAKSGVTLSLVRRVLDREPAAVMTEGERRALLRGRSD
jgi:chromosomal replication initiation ATPase DnaA